MFAISTKILVVDDMNMFRTMVRQSLTQLGYKNTTEASDGTFAWQSLVTAREDNLPFELVISDWNMPKMKGIELLKKVRGETWGKELPFIMLTAEAEREMVLSAVKEGVDMYMIKPFTVDTLKLKLQQTWDKNLKRAG